VILTEENRSAGRETCDIITLQARDVTWTGLGSNACLPGKTPATSSLIYGTALLAQSSGNKRPT
jgi:hypothetical protein